MRADDDSGDDLFRIDEPKRQSWFSWGDAWSWLFPVLGLCVFEWFANPGVSVAVACLKFGYADFRTAWWLKGDRQAGRGDVHAPFYFARGCFVSALCSGVGLALVGLFERAIIKNNAFGVFEDLMLSTTLVMFIGVFLGVIAAGFGFKRVVELRRSVWMDSTIHQARRERRWTAVCQGRRNEFHLFCIGLLVLSLIWLAGVTTGSILLFHDPRNAIQPFWERLISNLWPFAIFGLPAVWFAIVGLKAWGHAARSAASVWAGE